MERIVFYDGECGFCSRWVQWILRTDRANKFLFAPLQGTTAQDRLGALPEDLDEWSLVLLENGQPYYRSTAALKVLSEAGGILWLARIFLIVPKLIRDGVYKWIARNRKRFGTSCLLPSAELKRKFLP